jgi:hypothetical protein
MKCDAEKLEQIASDSAYHDVGVLPSQGIPYKGRMEKLFIRPFRLPELRLLSKAVQLNELGPMIRAVDLAISHDVYDLTIGDFYYVLLWLRMYSMPDTPQIVEWYCDQPYYTHNETKEVLLYSMETWPNAEELDEKYSAVSCDTHNTSVIQIPGVEVLCLEEDFVLDEDFDFPRVNILENMNAAMLDPDMSMLVPALQWMKGNTWEEKIAVLEADTSLGLFGKALKVNKSTIHGINEVVTFSCRKCRVEHTRTLTLNAASFFR